MALSFWPGQTGDKIPPISLIPGKHPEIIAARQQTMRFPGTNLSTSALTVVGGISGTSIDGSAATATIGGNSVRTARRTVASGISARAPPRWNCTARSLKIRRYCRSWTAKLDR
jgi:hypothetical protein